MSKPDKTLLAMAANPEAYRETPVDFDAWGWRDNLAATMHAQHDYDTRRLEQLRTFQPMKPSQGWKPDDRFLYRGMVDAMIDAARKLPLGEKRELLKAMRKRKP